MNYKSAKKILEAAGYKLERTAFRKPGRWCKPVEGEHRFDSLSEADLATSHGDEFIKRLMES